VDIPVHSFGTAHFFALACYLYSGYLLLSVAYSPLKEKTYSFYYVECLLLKAITAPSPLDSPTCLSD